MPMDNETLLIFENENTICSNSIDKLEQSAKEIKVYINLSNRLDNLRRIANTDIMLINKLEDIIYFI